MCCNGKDLVISTSLPAHHIRQKNEQCSQTKIRPKNVASLQHLGKKPSNPCSCLKWATAMFSRFISQHRVVFACLPIPLLSFRSITANLGELNQKRDMVFYCCIHKRSKRINGNMHDDIMYV